MVRGNVVFFFFFFFLDLGEMRGRERNNLIYLVRVERENKIK